MSSRPAPGAAPVRPRSEPGRRPRPLRLTTKALPGQARGHNRALVLQSLYSHGPQSRADLARATGLTPVTVSALVAELLADGLASDLGPQLASRVGKPATLVGFEPGAAHVVSLDLSADHLLRGAVLDLSGAVQARAQVSRGERTGEAVVDVVRDLAGELAAGSQRPVLGVGVGSPGVVDHDGIVLEAPNLGWVDLPLAQRLTADLGLPVRVTNDANAAALAEHTFGGAGDAGVLVITVGQGVGSGILLDGALVRGERFAAGEIGHVVVDEDGDRCACGRWGCLETLLSVPLLRRRLEEAPPERRDDVLAGAGRRLGEALAPVISALDLGEIVLNGPADLLDGPLRDALVRTVRRRVLPVVADALDIRLSALHEDGVLLGACVLVLSGELGVS